jgi:hypothetical protein
MALSGPIVLKGFTPYAPAESGLVAGTVAGRIDGDEPIEAFGLQKEILRQFGGTSRLALTGPFSVQVVEDETPGAVVLFDWTVELEIVAVAFTDPFFGGGVGLYDWFWYTQSFNASVGRFKTRVVNATPIPIVIEPDPLAVFKTYPVPVAPLPDAPSYCHLIGYRTQSITARMPATLPARATSYTLQIAAGGNLSPLEDTWIDFAMGLQPGDERLVPAAAVGESDAERLWFRLKAVNAAGSSRGPAHRDAPQTWFNAIQLGGYQGWHAGYVPGEGPPSPYHEAGSGYQEIGAQVSIGGQIIGRWSGPIYKCELPAGAIIKIISDKWAPASTIRNKFTFAVSYKPGGVVESAVQHPEIGKTFYLYKGSGDVRLGRSSRREGYLLKGDDPVVVVFWAGWGGGGGGRDLAGADAVARPAGGARWALVGFNGRHFVRRWQQLGRRGERSAGYQITGGVHRYRWHAVYHRQGDSD